MLGMIAVPDYLTYWRTGLVCYSFGEVTPQKQYEEGEEGCFLPPFLLESSNGKTADKKSLGGIFIYGKEDFNQRKYSGVYAAASELDGRGEGYRTGGDGRFFQGAA